MQEYKVDNIEKDNVVKNGKSTNSTEPSAPVAVDFEETEDIDLATGPANIVNIIGEFGLYQLSLTVLAFIRYVCVAMMTNSGALLAPDMDFWCVTSNNQVNQSLVKDHGHKLDIWKNNCTFIHNQTKSKCTQWIYNTTTNDLMLTDTFNLVCDRDWLRSAFQGSVSIGVMIASVVFGSCADEHGRKFTLRLCLIGSVIAGSISVIAPNYIIYTSVRSICTMCDLGIVGSLYITLVETLGNKTRGPVCVIVFTGWSIGVMIMPWVIEYLIDFRSVMTFTVVCHAITIPWLLTVGESIRWCLINGRLNEAEEEIQRICCWNISSLSAYEIQDRFKPIRAKFALAAEKYELELKETRSFSSILSRSLFGSFAKVGQIFQSRELTTATISIVWVAFTNELLYMFFTQVNSDVGGNVKLNYAIGGLMEILATFIAIYMIAKLRRRFSLSSTSLIISLSLFVFAFTHQNNSLAIPVLNFAKLAVSTLSSLVYVIVTELYPTNLRQTGMGLTSTLASLGAVSAPFIRKELADAIGLSAVLLILFVIPITAALIITYYLRETKDVELPDSVDEIIKSEKLSGKVVSTKLTDVEPVNHISNESKV